MRTRLTRSSVVVLFVLVGIASGRPAAQQAANDQLPAFRSGVELVTLDIAVVDKDGRPIRDLKPDDFSVTVGGEPRRVVTAEYINASAQAGASVDPAVVPLSTNEGPGVGRLFLFVVDGHTLETGDARHVADAAARFFAQLTSKDRSALVSLPIGRSVPFTWAHDRVRQALLQAASSGSIPVNWEFGSLSEARDIAARGSFALHEVAARECGASALASGSSAPSSVPVSPGSPSGGSGESSRGGTSGGQSTSRGSVPSFDALADDRCYREIQSQAEMAWNLARTNSLASIASLRSVLATLEQLQGDKTIVLISGGWPMDEHDESSVLSTLAADAAAARARLFTIFVPRPTMSASRRTINFTVRNDQPLYLWPLERLAVMTGGESFRADASAEGIFDRLSRELAGFYRIGVEKTATDAGASGRHMKVRIARGGATIRAREFFDVPTYEDRDWAARLASALDSPVPATAVSLRVTSYVAADPDDPSSVRLVLAGDASRLQSGDATMRLVVRDLDGQRVTAGEHRLGTVTGTDTAFATNLRVAPGDYIVRIAVQDAAGRVGSVDHRVVARPVPIGALSVTGPVLVQVPAAGSPHVTVETVRPDERLALEVALDGDEAQVADADVTFEVAASADGPPLLQPPANLMAGRRRGAFLAQAVADLRVLPPGRYVARAKIRSGSEAGEVRRAFVVVSPTAAETLAAGATVAPGSAVLASSSTSRGRAFALPPFEVRQVLAPRVLHGFLDRVAARPDAAFPGVGELLGKARAENLASIKVSEAQAAQTPVAAFVRGLVLLANNQLNPAATAFRAAMRASPDFYPAMVYLGACYAAGGKDKDAAAVWRTALIKEADSPSLHVMLADALLRQGNSSGALDVINAARERWPQDEELTQRFVRASLMAGRPSLPAWQALDALVDRHAADEPSLALALQLLYESFTAGRTIEDAEHDRARLVRLADAYRARGGPMLALVETWVAAVKAGAPRTPRQ